MFRKIAVSFALSVVASTVPALAADNAAITTVVAERATDSTSNLEAPISFVQAPNVSSMPSRGGLLPSLYVSLAGLNAFDAFTTVKGVSKGAVEANSLMRGAAGSPFAMAAVKGGITAGSILVAERLWKSGHRGQAIGMMIASNAMMVAVGARNSSVLRNQR